MGDQGSRKKSHEKKTRQILLKKDAKLRFHFHYQDKDYEFKSKFNPRSLLHKEG